VTTFSVWAPTPEHVELALGPDGDDRRPMQSGDGGWWALDVPDAGPGTTYGFVLDGDGPFPDPRSGWQPAGVHGPSRLPDHDAFQWSDDHWRPSPLADAVIYELHIGTFTEAGTFDGTVDRLDHLVSLGVTHVELMPVVEFPGNRGWGYDGVDLFAPHHAYGGPEGLKRLVDACHARGLAVILDVVYNHLGPDGNYLPRFGPYFSHRYTTPWGDAVNFDGAGSDEVRRFVIDNARMWLADYHVDGLRLDATHAIFDDSEPHVLAELADRVRAVDPRALVTSEMETGDLRPIGEWGHDAQWADDLHHVLHVLLTGEREGYYSEYEPSVEELWRTLMRTPAERLVVCSQNHDQVGNRALGDRPKPDELPLRAATVLLAPQTPLLFMGEEYGEQRPFQFFTDHIDPAIAEATREGRRREFELFSAFSGQDVPDPQDPETFERSKLDPGAGDPEVRDLYKRLLELRRELPKGISIEADENAGVLRICRGDVEVVLDFSARRVEVDAAATAPRRSGRTP
jgi:maltooligosyltrehalose trehalohydrolase